MLNKNNGMAFGVFITIFFFYYAKRTFAACNNTDVIFLQSLIPIGYLQRSKSVVSAAPSTPIILIPLFTLFVSIEVCLCVQCLTDYNDGEDSTSD